VLASKVSLVDCPSIDLLIADDAIANRPRPRPPAGVKSDRRARAGKLALEVPCRHALFVESVIENAISR
jgi:hypothetical protein